VVDDSIFEGSDAAVIPAWSPDVVREPVTEREVRLQLYRDYLERCRQGSLGPEQKGDIDLSETMARLKALAAKDETLQGPLDIDAALAALASNEEDPWGVGVNEFPTTKKRKRPLKSTNLDPSFESLGTRLELVELPGFGRHRPKKTFRPSTPELDMV
jgi:hypothetical protein